jgi:NitT/TauT family transport system substrate-binding protein
VIRVSSVGGYDLAPLFYAQRTGMFKQAGLDMRYEPASSGAEIIPAVVQGTYDIGHANVISLILAHIHGIPIGLIAPGAAYDTKAPYAELAVPADSTVHTGADLNGQLIAVPSLNDFTTVGISAWVDKNGGDSKTLKFLELPSSASPAALEQHRVAAAMLYYPAATQAVAAGKARILPHGFSAVGDYFMATGWIASTTWAAAHPAAARAFTGVVIRAIRYANAHHAEMVPIEAEITGIPAEFIRVMPPSTSAPALDPALIQPVIDVADRYHMIPHAFPASEILIK